MSNITPSARKQAAAVPTRKKTGSVASKKTPVPGLLPSPALDPATKATATKATAPTESELRNVAARQAPKRPATPVARIVTPPKISPKKRKADRNSEGDPSVGDLDSLTLNTPTRRSPRKPVPTEKALYNIDQAMAELPQTPPGLQPSNLLRAVKRRVAEADANDAACASDTGTTISWSPSPKPKARPRPRPIVSRPRAMPRSKWPSPPPERAPVVQSAKGKNKAIVLSSDEEEDQDVDRDYRIRDLTPFEDSELPTLDELASAFGDPSVPSSTLFDDIAAESGGEDAELDDASAERLEEDQYDLDDSFIDDSGATEEDDTAVRQEVHGLDLDVEDEDIIEDDDVEFVEDPVEDNNGAEGWFEPNEQSPLASVTPDLDPEDEDNMFVDEDIDDTIRATANMNDDCDDDDDIFAFDNDPVPDAQTEPTADEAEEYLSDFPPVTSKPGRSFRSPPKKISAREAKLAKERQGQQALSFAAASPSPQRPSNQRVLTKGARDPVRVPTPTASTTNNRQAPPSSPSFAKTATRDKDESSTLPAVPSKKARSSGGVRPERHSTASAAARASSSSTSIAGTAGTSAVQSAAAPLDDPNSALDVSLQSSKLRPLYANLPAKARVSRGMVYGFKGAHVPVALPYDGDYAVGLCTDIHAKKRLAKALQFDAYNRIMSLNRNGNVPVINIRFECAHVVYAGRSLPAVYVNTGFIWSSDLQGVRGSTKNVYVRSICQEWELLQGSLAKIISAQEFQAHVDVQNGAMMFASKKVPEENSNQGRTDPGKGVGRTLPPVASGGNNTSNTGLPACALKKHLRFDETIPVFDGRSSSRNGKAGFLFAPEDWQDLDSLPRFPDGEELPEDALVTVGFTVSSFGPLSGMTFKGVNLHVLFIIVLDLPAA
ncbi:hypothetical protein V5O48_004947 [Marasmius crinis-equi]|uniref:Uncharacterized protein n=1 Tax=Marasmius crinis-equi TaxID=585013 RepID=A0ABR3FNR0_9AGAR